MAKKSFKSGLGSLIQSSSIEFEDNGFTKETVNPDRLKFRLQQLQDELYLWRTGKLTPEIFSKTLAENKLKYNPKNNSFEKLID
ncbi:MAG: hypothetical protein U0W24_23870 [Bacteroidales bacterium]